MDESDRGGSPPSVSMLQGRRIRLISCDDPYTQLKPGTRGVITLVDGLGTVHVAWDDGSRLGLIPGVDLWEVDAGFGPDGGEGNDLYSTERVP
jgi:hypothetical protein